MNEGAVDALYRLHHLILRVQSPEGPHVGHVHEALVYKGAERVGAPQSAVAEADIEVRFVNGRALPSLPADAEPIALYEHGLEVSRSSAGVHVRATWVAAQVEPASSRVTVTLRGALPADAAQAVFYLVVLALMPLLRRLGLYGLHAAALVPDGETGVPGVLLAAPSGRGKTTTALTLVRQGWSPVSDDALLLRIGSEGNGRAIEALSFRRDVCLRPAASGPFPEISGRDWPRSPSDARKWRIDVGAAFGAFVVAACVPSLLLVPEITETARSEVIPLERAEALRHLVDCSAIRLVADPEDTARTLGVLHRLAGQARPYRLLAGRDVVEEPERVGHLISQALQDTI